jgi:hypothetical protein
MKSGENFHRVINFYLCLIRQITFVAIPLINEAQKSFLKCITQILGMAITLNILSQPLGGWRDLLIDVRFVCFFLIRRWICLMLTPRTVMMYSGAFTNSQL